jgi:CDP-glucose 4,6-dehydratase
MARMVSAALDAAYQGRRVLITGHTGFKGSWLAICLRQLGAEVAGYALAPESPNDLFVRAGVERGLHHTVGDVRDLRTLQREFDRFRPDCVFHLAAQPLVRRSFAEPKLTFDTNVGGSVNLLEAVRATPSVRALVFVTSDKCYRNHEWVWGYRENDELGGHDPYSASKAAAEIVFSSYVDALFHARPTLGAASARAGNVIGGGDWAADRIVPDCIRALSDRQPVVLRNPASTRPWQHVLEPVVAYLLLAARLLEQPAAYAGAWNIGPRVESIRTVEALATAIVAAWGSGTVRVERSAVQPHEATLLHLNCDKAHQYLGWRPRWDFERTIAETVGWYAAVHGGADAGAVSEAQARRYLEELA